MTLAQQNQDERSIEQRLAVPEKLHQHRFGREIFTAARCAPKWRRAPTHNCPILVIITLELLFTLPKKGPPWMIL